jgi:preprotein translocase subunit SecG
MSILFNLVVVLQILAAVAMAVLILLQHGKGADMGASFGSGASGSLFGATGSANFLSRSTAAAATLFFVCTLALSYLATHNSDGSGVMSSLAAARPAASAAHAASVPAGIAQIPGAPQQKH